MGKKNKPKAEPKCRICGYEFEDTVQGGRVYCAGCKRKYTWRQRVMLSA